MAYTFDTVHRTPREIVSGEFDGEEEFEWDVFEHEEVVRPSPPKRAKRYEFPFTKPNATPSVLCLLQPHCGCHAFLAPTTEQIDRHGKEHMRRLAWCIKEGHKPAHDRVHLAPGDDSQFVYGVPPWHPDGSPNPQGIFFCPPSYEDTAFVALQREAENAGWSCSSCNTWIKQIPRAYTSGPEPYDWWWCRECRATKCKPSQKELKATALAKTIHKIDKMLA